MRRSCYFVAAAAISGLLTGCAVDTPATRIARNPAIFESLPARERELVQQGRIERGMSPDAVRLAWGPPRRLSEGFDGGVEVMRWEYIRLRPYYTSSFYGGFGYARYPYGPWGYRSYYPYGFGYAPEVAYVPERNAWVEFRNRRVAAWEVFR